MPPKDAVGQDEKGRLWDLLNILYYEAKKAKGDRIDFMVFFFQGTETKVGNFYALIGPGDDASPVITVMLPWED